MNTNSNLYTFIYASVLVIIVAAGLSFAAMKLKPLQDNNVKIEKMMNILSSASIESTTDDAESKYNKYITNTYVVNTKGEKIEGADAFSVKLEVEFRKNFDNWQLPVFECEKDGKKLYIFPLRGKGLWGPIWGYLSLENDFNTVFGATFDHKSETPGLGAEINRDWFEKPFTGKKLFNESSELVSIVVHKGGAEAAGDLTHGVDAISGGTITSKALEDMVRDCFKGYEAFLKSNQ